MASGSVQFRWSGLDAFAESLRRFGVETEKELEREMEVIAARWAAEARRRVPAESGLADAILHDSGQEGAEFFAAVGSNQESAERAEFGTDWTDGGERTASGSGGPTAFVRPAFAAIEDWAIDRLMNVMKMD